MRLLCLLCCVIFLFSCNDGEFDVPSFEFSDQVSTCGEYLLYRTNTDKTEAIILHLQATALGTEIGSKSYPVSATNQVSYRAFDTAINHTYFCQDLPPTGPNVTNELTAESGTIVISTSTGVNTEYQYDIEIQQLVFVNGNEQIFFETFDFGTVNSSD
ncbi:MAG: hypothetical protein QGH06_06510 [Lutibacter sp.]|nr:hypothetical protein [Lutibacter sp.]